MSHSYKRKTPLTRTEILKNALIKCEELNYWIEGAIEAARKKKRPALVDISMIDRVNNLQKTLKSLYDAQIFPINNAEGSIAENVFNYVEWLKTCWKTHGEKGFRKALKTQYIS